MPTVKLTKRAVDGIRPQPARTFWYDTQLKGFGLKVEPSGVMTWILEYRPGAGGRGVIKRRLTLGRIGALTPEQARELAKTTLVSVHRGEDPAALKADAKTAKTVGELCDLYFADAERGNVISRRGSPKKASTLAVDRGRIARHIKPLLGKKLVRDVTKADVERFLRDVAAGKTAVDEKTKARGRAIVTGGRGTERGRFGCSGASSATPSISACGLTTRHAASPNMPTGRAPVSSTPKSSLASARPCARVRRSACPGRRIPTPQAGSTFQRRKRTAVQRSAHMPLPLSGS